MYPAGRNAAIAGVLLAAFSVAGGLGLTHNPKPDTPLAVVAPFTCTIAGAVTDTRVSQLVAAMPECKLGAVQPGQSVVVVVSALRDRVRLQALRAPAAKGRVVWVLPVKSPATRAVQTEIAQIHGDRVVQPVEDATKLAAAVRAVYK